MKRLMNYYCLSIYVASKNYDGSQKDSQHSNWTEKWMEILRKKETYQANLEINWINEVLDDDPGYLYVHHGRCRSNGVNIRNIWSCKGNTEHNLQSWTNKKETKLTST